jgi:hypothetical protein
LLIIAGGTNGGASRSVLRTLEPIRLAFLQLPEEYQPEILFVGNEAIQQVVQAAFAHSTHLHVGPNIRPDLDHESFEPVRSLLAQITVKIRARQLPGLAEMLARTHGNSLPSAAGLGRVIRFLSQAHGPKKGILGVDLGSSTTTMAAAFDGRMSIGVFPEIRASGMELEQAATQSIQKWLISADLSREKISEYRLNKSIYPASLPLTVEDLDMQYALTRQALANALEVLKVDFPADWVNSSEGYRPWVEPILVTGSALTNVSSPGQACLLWLCKS